MYVTLECAKKHLNIDESFKDDDSYILSLIDVAENAVSRHIDCKLEKLQQDNDGEMPAPVVHAVKLLVANLYANRESVAYSQAVEVPKSYDYLLDLYRNYGGKEESTR